MSDLFRERWAWVSLVTVVVIATVGTKLWLQDTTMSRRHSESDDDFADEPHLAPSQEIPISALRTLITSPVPDISSAAIALANKRLGDERTYWALISSVKHDLNSSQSELRKRAETGLNYLDNHVPMSYLPPQEPSIASTTSPADESHTGRRRQVRTLWDHQAPAQHQSRPRTAQAPADRERRRRRREAMLFHEGSGELSEGDIIELNSALAEIAMERER